MSLHVFSNTLARRRLSSLVLVLLALLILSSCKSEEEQVADFMTRGEEHAEAGRDKEAIIEFRNVIKVDPNYAPGHYALSQAYLRAGQVKQGYWELRETVRLDSSHVDARLRFGTLSIAARDFEEVLAQATAVTEAEPERAEGWSLRGQALEGLERVEEAEAFYLKAAALDAENTDYLLLLARYYGRTKRNEDGEKMLLKLVEVDPGFRSNTLLARFYVSTNRPDDADVAFRAAFDIEANDPREQESAYINLANFLRLQERNAEALALLEEGMENLERKSNLLYLLAQFYASEGDNEKADAIMEQAARESQDDAKAQLILSAYLSSRGDAEGALAAAEVALAIDPEDIVARLRKAELLLNLGFSQKDVAQVAAARSIVDDILRAQPSHSQACFVRAKIELAQGAPESAIVSLRCAIDGKPNWAQAHFVLGSAFALRNDKTNARIELARALELDGRLTDARKTLAKIHAELGEHEYAIEQGRLYLEAKPEDAQARIMVAQSFALLREFDEAYSELQKIPEESRTPESQYATARILMGRGQMNESLVLLLETNESRPGEYDILRSLMLVEGRLGKLPDSAARVDAVIEAEPSNSRLVQLRGEIAEASGDVAAAEAAYKKAVEIDPDNVAAYAHLAALYKRTGRLDETITTYEAALERAPDNCRMHHELGVLYEYRTKIDLAMAQYELAIECNSALGDAKNNLAYLLAERGETLDRALDLAQEAKALLPNSPNTADTLGWVLYKRGVPSAAVGYLREAEAGMAGKNPDNENLGVIRHHLALAYVESGDSDKAIESLDRAIASLDAAGADRSEEPGWAAEVRSMRDQLAENPAG